MQTEQEYIDRKNALVYYELAGYNAAYADRWASDEYGDKGPGKLTELYETVKEVWPAERKLARLTALYEYTRKQFISEKDMRAIAQLTKLSKDLTDAEREYMDELSVKLETGGVVTLWIGSEQVEDGE